MKRLQRMTGRLKDFQTACFYLRLFYHWPCFAQRILIGYGSVHNRHPRTGGNPVVFLQIIEIKYLMAFGLDSRLRGNDDNRVFQTT
ncbi:hypothetical protein [Neisseria sp.]|uniref:hypothetical protein n=1 Tax=Neisseria sp. TaxID=192066 RepID=UPI0035A1B033